MTTHSHDAEGIAGIIAVRVWYPRVADAVAGAIRHCALEGCALDDDQTTQIYRAVMEAGDGVLEQISLAVDEFLGRRLVHSAEFNSFPLDPEVEGAS